MVPVGHIRDNIQGLLDVNCIRLKDSGVICWTRMQTVVNHQMSRRLTNSQVTLFHLCSVLVPFLVQRFMSLTFAQPARGWSPTQNTILHQPIIDFWPIQRIVCFSSQFSYRIESNLCRDPEQGNRNRKCEDIHICFFSFFCFNKRLNANSLVIIKRHPESFFLMWFFCDWTSLQP